MHILTLLALLTLLSLGVQILNFFPKPSFRYKTKNVHENIIATPGQKGAFTFSGYGDGMYDCYICKNDYGQIVGLMLDFLNVLK